MDDDALYIDIQHQPDDTTCGPTCLHAVYRYFGEPIALDTVIAETSGLDDGGTFASHLGRHALGRGYRATMYTYNLRVFDPTWFEPGVDLAGRLREQAAVKTQPKFLTATQAYLDFLAAGGEIRHAPLEAGLLQRYLARGIPILTGLSATYLYGCSREVPETNEYDDVRGEPAGHFVVIYGVRPEESTVLVADPLGSNPLHERHYYRVDLARLVSAILLGIVTYDGNLLMIEPRADA